MNKFPKNIIVMKVGPHSGMSLDEIVLSKHAEEQIHGMHFWGYSGVFCTPKATQEFCNKCYAEEKVFPKLVLIETKSPYESNVGKIDYYSVDSKNYLKFDAPVQLQGAQFSFVAKKLSLIDKFPISLYKVVGGKNDGIPLLNHLRFRVNKSFATLDDNPILDTTYVRVLAAELVPPYSIWLKSKL